MADNHYEAVTLSEWIGSHSKEEELREVFLNLDKALKYIHNHGYCVDVFHPTVIEVLDNKPDHIRFKKLIELSKDSIRRQEMIKEDLFRSSFIQIGIYSNSLKYLNPEFLKSNFDSFIQFIPNSDVPYYRGIIQRNAAVYLCEYDVERRKRDLEDLENQIDDNGDSKSAGNSLVKKNGASFGIEPVTNDKINDSIYRQINGLNDSAFVNALIIPTIVFVVLFIFGLFAWIISIFG